MSEQSFIGYEYKEFSVSRSLKQAFADGIQNFGWQIEQIGEPVQKPHEATISCKRSRDLRKNAELTRLQGQFESCIAQVQALERKRNLGSTVLPLVIGIIGTAFMAGSVFAVTAEKILLCVLLAIPAFAGWAAPCFLHHRLAKKQQLQIDPLIEDKYDEIYETCKKAHALL